MNYSTVFFIILFVLAGMIFQTSQVMANTSDAEFYQEKKRPLLLPGKKSLYQRVLARPGAILYKKLQKNSETLNIDPFSVFYVYERVKKRSAEWLLVGSNSHGSIKGWIKNRQLIQWDQALTISFREPLGRDRTLLYRDKNYLKNLIMDYDLSEYRKLYRSAKKGNIDSNSPVIAIQPESYTDIQNDFYLIPILSHEDIYLGGEQARMLQVATVPLVRPDSKPAKANIKATPAPITEDSYRSGIVFVIDTTLSMGPYIDRTREAVRRIYDEISRANLTDQVSFGLVAFRDSLRGVPDLEYTDRLYADLGQGENAEQFLHLVDNVQPASVSSRGFNEDPYAGIKRAIEGVDWDGFAARYVVVITDAGARQGYDVRSKTGMGAETLRQMAEDNGIALWTLHLLTPDGKDNHASAAEQYKTLSRYPGIGDLYYGVDMGNVNEFGHVLEIAAKQITHQIRITAESKPLQVTPPLQFAEDAEFTSFQDKVATLGYALRMRYLQRQKGVEIPSIFSAWLVDRDFQRPEVPALDVRVLLTRSQLSDLHVVLKRILEAAEDGIISPQNFLNDLKSLAASLSRDPTSASNSTRATSSYGGNLADMGYMREFIEGLPYKGEIMNISLDDWEVWSAKQQLSFIHKLEEKINYYSALYDNTDLWVSLGGGPINGDSVFPIALDMLP